MYTNHSIVFAFALALAACGDQTANDITGPLPPPPPTAPAQANVRGIVVIGHDGSAPSLDVAGMRVYVQGEGADEMRNVAGAEVLAVGTWDPENGALIVERFEVLVMGGRKAYDGVLELRDDTYVIRSANHELHWLADPSAALTEQVGRRVWLTERVGIAPASFGVISFGKPRLT